MAQEVRKKPEWLKVRAFRDKGYENIRKLLRDKGLHTVCQEALCPNIGECFRSGTATFLILGDTCTRSCTFCNVSSESPCGLDVEEPRRLLSAVKAMNLQYVVITSVTRDDLSDGGASVYAESIRLIKDFNNHIKVETLIPDFQGDYEALKTVLDAGPDVLNHNIETVARLYPEVRPQADYRRSLELLKRVSDYSPSIPPKSGLMLGLGEEIEEVKQALRDLREHNCRMLTVGQYLAPSQKHHPVVKYYHPDEFKEIEQYAYEIGFDSAACAPLVRSSYHAESQSASMRKDES
ncbi:MAG: lipoyl synthase [candidate division Zixibacteria bacterium]|nr:lipoyl synthase [candidate division Zixibacteria bacterium]